MLNHQKHPNPSHPRGRSGLKVLLAGTLLTALIACNTPPPPIQPVDGKPAAPQGLSAAANGTSITLKWTANTEATLSGYLVYRGGANGAFTKLTASPITATDYTDSGLNYATTYQYQVVAVNKVGESAAATASAKTADKPTGPQPALQLANPVTVPYPDRLIFSRIQNPNPSIPNVTHTTNVLTLSNTGVAPLVISALTLQDAWQLDNPPALPLTIAPGASQNLTLRFTAGNTGYHAGSLTIQSNDPTTPSRVVQLRGLSQDHSEDNQEPSLPDLLKALGYRVNLVGGQVADSGSGAYGSYLTVNQDGLVRRQGEEVMSAYWQAADASQKVQVTQLASYHTQGNTATLSWYSKGKTTANTIMTAAGAEAQSVLPHLNGSPTQLANASFTPSSTFGFKVDAEWSDPAKNSQTADINHGCTPGPCGQHLRFWPLRDRTGQLVPNTYLLGMDYSGINYDYQDNLYLISNIKPAPMLIDVGMTTTYTDPAGNVWLPDQDQNKYTVYTPSTAIAEPSTAYTGSIAGTTNPQLYRTYRGNVGTSTPQDQRVIAFNIPVGNGTYNLNLHFADLAHTTSGQRVFDVTVENKLQVDDLDIVARAGGGKTALVVPVNGVQVTDGLLTISLKASIDFPSIAGIEIIPQ
ncbi:malectin domain-containing carbohydrate-binding protein [Deinococcus sonorensis]|uniref:Malectin domain-containing carbohydrate-binding protein n=2 Tax=Deinococcus sonorensis TaxID=309891 RepID=A0AAU7UEJ2_9DEIO